MTTCNKNIIYNPLRPRRIPYHPHPLRQFLGKLCCKSATRTPLHARVFLNMSYQHSKAFSKARIFSALVVVCQQQLLHFQSEGCSFVKPTQINTLLINDDIRALALLKCPISHILSNLSWQESEDGALKILALFEALFSSQL